jgi:hypothetical protein
VPTGTEWLNVLRVDGIMRGLADTRELPANLLFLNRTAQVDARNGEIMSREIRRVHISDVISKDGKATVYTNAKATFETNELPKIKHGVELTESEIELFAEIRADGRIPGGSQWQDIENRIMEDILLGIRQRQEQLLVSMACDSVTYDRLGIKFSGNWGMPSALKPTVAVGWEDAANATPVNDCLNLQFQARVVLGQEFNRITMTTPAFQKMIATTEFQAKARVYLAPNVSYANLSLTDINFQKGIAQNLLGVATIEFYDQRYWSQGVDDGLYQSSPYLPLNKVIFSNSADDNRRDVEDFANGIVVESMVGGLAGSVTQGNFAAPRRGPISFATVPADLNPPSITYWGAMVGFPRKKQLAAKACLTIGSIPQTIPIIDPIL